MLYESPYLAHYGIKGQKWGMRNYQNEDGSLTEAGKARYGVSTGEGRGRGSGGPLDPNTKAGRLRRNIIIGGVGAAAALGTAAILMKNPSILKAGLNGLRRGMGRFRAAAQGFMNRHFHGKGTGLTLPRLTAPSNGPGFGSRMATNAKNAASKVAGMGRRAADRASYYGHQASAHAKGFANAHFRRSGVNWSFPRIGNKAPGFGSRVAASVKNAGRRVANSRVGNRAAYYGQHARGAARRGATYARSVGNNYLNRFRGVTFKGARAAKTWRG